MYPFTLPSGIECELREMTGAEEDILRNQRLMHAGEGLNLLMRNCLVRLGEQTEITATDVADLLSGDRTFLLVRLRQISLGDEMTLTLTCPRCHEVEEAHVNLDELEVIPYPEEREHSCVLPKSGQTVVFVPLTGQMERRLTALKDADASQAILMRILSIDGKPPTKRSLTTMPYSDRQVLEDAMAQQVGGIKTRVDVECWRCGTTTSMHVFEDVTGFFGLRVR